MLKIRKYRLPSKKSPSNFNASIFFSNIDILNSNLYTNLQEPNIQFSSHLLLMEKEQMSLLPRTDSLEKFCCHVNKASLRKWNFEKIHLPFRSSPNIESSQTKRFLSIHKYNGYTLMVYTSAWKMKELESLLTILVHFCYLDRLSPPHETLFTLLHDMTFIYVSNA